jgi:hypothetical protein
MMERPSNKLPKKQITVRVDRELWEQARRKAQALGFRTMTDYVEMALTEHNQSIPDPPFTLRGRQLYTRLSLQLQRVTMGFWAYLGARHNRPEDRLLARWLPEVLLRHYYASGAPYLEGMRTVFDLKEEEVPRKDE